MPALGGNIFGQRCDSHSGKPHAQQQVWIVDVLGRKELVLQQSVLKAAHAGQQLRQAVADDLLVAGLVGGAFPDGLIEIAKRVVRQRFVQDDGRTHE